MPQVRVRFAPSPTGFLHVGGARTALFNYFLARAKGGVFVLRIEDTDTERNKPEFEREILESMQWLGMKWDEGPFYQTQRFDRYREVAYELLKKGEAYKCTCSEQDLAAMRAKAEAEGRKPMYDRRCRDRKDVPADAPFVIRIKAPLSGEITVNDGIKGEVRFTSAELDDFIIFRTNGTPTYNFTVVVDDIDMRITQVVRAEEHLNNTPKQMIVMKALGWTPPAYAHVPLVLAPDKTKLSKRHGAVAVTQYREEGYLAEALVNYLARLGWAKGDQEIFSMDELCRNFSLEGCGSSGSVFDKAKLDWYNAHYLKKLPRETVVAQVKSLYGKDLAPLLASASGQKILAALVERAVKLADLVPATAWVLGEDFEVKADDAKTVLGVAKPEVIQALASRLEAVPDADFTADKIGPVFKEVAASHGVKMPDVAKPARILLTGTLASPDIGLCCEALGKARVLGRLACFESAKSKYAG